MRSLRNDACRHWVITSNAHAHKKSKSKDPDHLQSWCWDAVWKAYHKNRPYDTDDELLAVDKFSAKCITKKAKAQLANNVTNIRCRIDKASKKRRVVTIPVSGNLINIRLSRNTTMTYS